MASFMRPAAMRRVATAARMAKAPAVRSAFVQPAINNFTRATAFHTTSKRDILPPPPQVVLGGGTLYPLVAGILQRPCPRARPEPFPRLLPLDLRAPPRRRPRAGGHLQDDWSAEIMLALRAVLFKLTVWDHDATYGAALQNLRYTDARSASPVLVPPSPLQKTAYGLVTVLGRYAWTRWEDWLVERDDGHDPPSPRVQRLARLTERLSTLHAGAACLSFLVFLLHGRYRTLLDRLLRMRLAPPTSQVSREVSFEYLNRQLVWHAFTEFLLFVLPLVGIHRWRRWFARTWRKTRGIMQTSGGGGDDDGVKRGEFAFLPERTCAICYQDQNTLASENDIMAAAASSGVVGSAQTDITNPYETMPCGCVYCFVCLATRLEREEGEGWTCLRCGALVKACKPWSGDVLEAPKKSPSSKVVAFSDQVDGAVIVDGAHDDAASSGGDGSASFDEAETHE
ncbi:hypothetical protein BN1723_002098 [Verticillium longisporum]|uniref:Pex N-terminal domain-containing protein n=1 Tax=Verticillium longisporum TaxID=100787 RepID=A0A0G4KYT6_VERLO|nr:hypothetical protein BN1723_002098 [Verticillium longisporum]